MLQFVPVLVKIRLLLPPEDGVHNVKSPAKFLSQVFPLNLEFASANQKKT